MKEFILFFNESNWKVTGFFPYTSHVMDSILSQNHNYKDTHDDFLQHLWDYFSNEAEKLGCELDNKVVIQITKVNNSFKSSPHNSILYIGRYDNKVSIGLSLWQDEWITDRNKYFPIGQN